MATKKAPRNPMVIVLGSTGTGKSELAVELAMRFRGEIINTDAMQMYAGLPILTNKMTTAEQRGVRHHLLGHIPLSEPPWVVGDFKREATRVVDEIRARGNLPVVVGGTHYYINALLNADLLPPATTPGSMGGGPDSGDEDLEGNGRKQVEGEGREGAESIIGTVNTATRFPELDAPTEVLYKRLQEVDPVMARRWHPNDRRKVRRSLEVYLTTGRKASDIYAEQQQRQRNGDANSGAHGEEEMSLTAGAAAPAVALERAPSIDPWETLLFWVYSDREVLKQRLDARVDKMVDGGLLDEVREVRSHLERERAAGREVDLTRGIWQSIGFRQFNDYLDATEKQQQPQQSGGTEQQADERQRQRQRLKDAAVEATQAATRRYASMQTRWIQNKLVPLLRRQHRDAERHLYLVDSSDLAAWDGSVVEPAVTVASHFLLDGNDERQQLKQRLPAPEELSEVARKVLATPGIGLSAVPCRRECELCGVTALYEHQWEKHLKSARHRKVWKGKRRKGLVPVGDNTRSLVVFEGIETQEEEEEIDLSGIGTILEQSSLGNDTG